jgi:hypothetical protein
MAKIGEIKINMHSNQMFIIPIKSSTSTKPSCRVRQTPQSTKPSRVVKQTPERRLIPIFFKGSQASYKVLQPLPH